ncbi:MAG: hypothetical protein ABIV47_13420 [Roseiflexaceae bacterium]
MEEGVALLAHWESFYVITGTAAAALTGLQFIVITLGAQMNRGNAETNRAFGTPTIVHFCAVLFIAGIMSAPWPSLAGIALVLGLCGVAGLVYAAVILRTVRHQTLYTPVLEDWVWHFTLPPLAYAILLFAALMLQNNPTASLFVAATSVLLLLFVGIHNAWDAATFITLYRHQQEQKREKRT